MNAYMMVVLIALLIGLAYRVRANRKRMRRRAWLDSTFGTVTYH